MKGRLQVKYKLNVKFINVISELNDYIFISQTNMPRHSEKHYILRDLYNCYLAKLVDDGELSKEVLDWFCMHEGLKEQRYLHPRASIPKSNWAKSILPNLSDS